MNVGKVLHFLDVPITVVYFFSLSHELDVSNIT